MEHFRCFVGLLGLQAEARSRSCLQYFMRETLVKLCVESDCLLQVVILVTT